MISLLNEMLQCLADARIEETGAVAMEWIFPETFSGFQGHFPGNPILPGVCLLQSLRVGLEQVWKLPLRLVEIGNAKFIAPTRPDEKLLFHVRETAREGALRSVKARVSRENQRIAELSVTFEAVTP